MSYIVKLGTREVVTRDKNRRTMLVNPYITSVNDVMDGMTNRWKFDNTITDSVGNNNLSVYAGNPVYVTGKNGQACSFDGTLDLLGACPTPITTDGNYTFALWFKTLIDPSTRQGLISMNPDESGTNRNGCLIIAGKVYAGYYNGSATVGVSESILQDIWYHLVVTNANGNIVAYLNTTPMSGNASNLIILDNALRIGRNGSILTGYIDDFRIYNRVLSAMEVEQIYTATGGT